ncbi:hypothetical protein HK101_002920 [Irineochytrium annulatum]|nr:hypothetical protein HK101_002920 [Irineochytrium annulatum]
MSLEDWCRGFGYHAADLEPNESIRLNRHKLVPIWEFLATRVKSRREVGRIRRTLQYIFETGVTIPKTSSLNRAFKSRQEERHRRHVILKERDALLLSLREARVRNEHLEAEFRDVSSALEQQERSMRELKERVRSKRRRMLIHEALEIHVSNYIATLKEYGSLVDASATEVVKEDLSAVARSKLSGLRPSGEGDRTAATPGANSFEKQYAWDLREGPRTVVEQRVHEAVTKHVEMYKEVAALEREAAMAPPSDDRHKLLRDLESTLDMMSIYADELRDREHALQASSDRIDSRREEILDLEGQLMDLFARVRDTMEMRQDLDDFRVVFSERRWPKAALQQMARLKSLELELRGSVWADVSRLRGVSLDTGGLIASMAEPRPRLEWNAGVEEVGRILRFPFYKHFTSKDPKRMLAHIHDLHVETMALLDGSLDGFPLFTDRGADGGQLEAGGNISELLETTAAYAVQEMRSTGARVGLMVEEAEEEHVSHTRRVMENLRTISGEPLQAAAAASATVSRIFQTVDGVKEVVERRLVVRSP